MTFNIQTKEQLCDNDQHESIFKISKQNNIMNIQILHTCEHLSTESGSPSNSLLRLFNSSNLASVAEKDPAGRVGWIIRINEKNYKILYVLRIGNQGIRSLENYMKWILQNKQNCVAR